MRTTCLFCVSKHISKAAILVSESCQGYPVHIWFAIGNLSEAEDEAVSEFPELAKHIREVRLALMGQVQDDGSTRPFYHSADRNDMVDLIIEARNLAAGINGIPENERIAKVLGVPVEA